VNENPFAVLGLPTRPGLSDEDVRAAWRRVAAATHPDREDGGDPARFGAAAAAYVMLRTSFGRGEALADLREAGRLGEADGTRSGSLSEADGLGVLGALLTRLTFAFAVAGRRGRARPRGGGRHARGLRKPRRAGRDSTGLGRDGQSGDGQGASGPRGAGQHGGGQHGGGHGRDWPGSGGHRRGGQGRGRRWADRCAGGCLRLGSGLLGSVTGLRARFPVRFSPRSRHLGNISLQRRSAWRLLARGALAVCIGAGTLLAAGWTPASTGVLAGTLTWLLSTWRPRTARFDVRSPTRRPSTNDVSRYR
jgi:curved DNA-binding protein CbpA